MLGYTRLKIIWSYFLKISTLCYGATVSFCGQVFLDENQQNSTEDN